jgi:hypothetical protein
LWGWSLTPGKKNLTRFRIIVITFLLLGIGNWIFSGCEPKGAVNSEVLPEIIWKIFLNGVEGF